MIIEIMTMSMNGSTPRKMSLMLTHLGATPLR